MKQSSPETKTRPSPSPGTRAGKGRAAPSVDSPWSGTPDREQQREAKRQAVLQAAAQLFNERGFSATSLDDIAARLGVSKPTLYYYVKNKDEILLQCVNQGLAMTLEGIEASRRAGGQAVDQLRACMQVYARIVTMDFGMCLIRVGDEQVPPRQPPRTAPPEGRHRPGLPPPGGRRRAGGLAGPLRPQDDGLRDCRRTQLDRPLVPAWRPVLGRGSGAAVH